MATTVHTPVTATQTRIRIRRYINTYFADHGYLPTSQEIESYLGLPRHAVDLEIPQVHLSIYLVP